MSMLSELVNLLTPYVKDAAPVAKLEIRQFAKEQNLLLRDDHLQFLMNFASELGGRLDIFKSYGGDFDFGMLKRVYLDKRFPVELPSGCTYFGSSFVGNSFCIDYESGKIFANDEGQRYGLLHEGIDGFLLRCLVSAYNEEAFSNKVVRQDLELKDINEFQLINEKNKIDGATAFEGRYQNIDTPKTLVEYYFVDRQLIYLFLPTRSMVMLSGGVLENLKS